MLRRSYDRIISLSAHPRALLWLGVLAIAESSVFPFAPDILIIPMVLARPRQAWRIAAVATCGSILGGLLGYAIGHFLFQAVGEPLIHFYGAEASYERCLRFADKGSIEIAIANLHHKYIAPITGHKTIIHHRARRYRNRPNFGLQRRRIFRCFCSGSGHCIGL